MKIEVTQWMTVTMCKTVDIPADITNEADAKDYAYEHGEWVIVKTHDTERAEYEVINE